MDALKFTSTIAVICVVIFVLACIYLGFANISQTVRLLSLAHA